MQAIVEAIWSAFFSPTYIGPKTKYNSQLRFESVFYCIQEETVGYSTSFDSLDHDRYELCVCLSQRYCLIYTILFFSPTMRMENALSVEAFSVILWGCSISSIHVLIHSKEKMTNSITTEREKFKLKIKSATKIPNIKYFVSRKIIGSKLFGNHGSKVLLNDQLSASVFSN